MQIIPVLDVKGGLIVRGVRGDRANYRPIETPLAETAEPVSVLGGLLSLAPFTAIYIADLDAITGRPPNSAVTAALSRAHPRLEWWLDAGFADASASDIAEMQNHVAVLGSETLLSARELENIDPRATVLSLDYRGSDFIGDPAILSRAHLWPSRVIVMTLARVGSGEGPDMERLGEIADRAGGRAIFAAGGVRGPDDLRRLRDAGFAGALVSSCLHDGSLSARELSQFMP